MTASERAKSSRRVGSGSCRCGCAIPRGRPVRSTCANQSCSSRTLRCRRTEGRCARSRRSSEFPSAENELRRRPEWRASGVMPRLASGDRDMLGGIVYRRQASRGSSAVTAVAARSPCASGHRPRPRGPASHCAPLRAASPGRRCREWRPGRRPYASAARSPRPSHSPAACPTPRPGTMRPARP